MGYDVSPLGLTLGVIVQNNDVTTPGWKKQAMAFNPDCNYNSSANQIRSILYEYI